MDGKEEAGIAPKVVQKWLGRSTIEMTMNVYTHINNDYEQEMVGKINNFNTKIQNKKMYLFDPYFDPYFCKIFYKIPP